MTREFWNNRASLGSMAGTRDLIAKQLEIEAIVRHVKDGMTILDAGCGNGITAMTLASVFNVDITGIDFSAKLIDSAQSAKSVSEFVGKVDFMVCDLAILPHALDFIADKYDLIYTERAIINLTNWNIQKRVIESLGHMLTPNGTYLMCECSQDGLRRLNALRLKVDLPVIAPPQHDRYLRDDELATVDLDLAWVEDFSSTYYFLSRVVNAWQAMQLGVEPSYDAPVNKLALSLPPMGNVGQVKLWAWR